MTTISHKNLTGNQLHESKGVDTATANTVYVANGSGSGSWTKLTANSLTGTATPLSSGFFQTTYETASGTGGGSATISAWTTRPINTVKVNDISSSSLASNQITLPSGTYYLEANLNFSGTSSTKSRLRNITDSSTVLTSISSLFPPSTSGTGETVLSGRFTITSSKVFEFQYYCSYNFGASSLGSPASAGDNEVYSIINIWKIS